MPVKLESEFGRTARSALVGDGHAMCRYGVRELLRSEIGVVSFVEAATFGELTDRLAHQDIDLVVVDLGLPGIGKIENLGAIRRIRPRAKVVALLEGGSRQTILGALATGVHGVVPKSLDVNDFAGAIRFVIDGNIYVPSGFADTRDGGDGGPAEMGPRTIDPGAVERLTRRQREVLALLGQGFSAKEIGRRMTIREGTVKIHLAAIYRRLGVRNRLEAALYGARLLG